MRFEPRDHAKHIFSFKNFSKMFSLKYVHIFANFWPVSSQLFIFTITDVTNLMMNIAFF